MNDNLKSLIEVKNKIESRQDSALRFVIGGYLNRKHRQNEKELNAAIIDHLIKMDSQFEKQVSEIRSLLEGEDINFKVTQEGASPWTYMTKRFKGRIHGNGFLYLIAKSNAIEFIDIQSHLFPIQYTGEIDLFGDTTIKVSKRSAAFFGRVPSTYLGRIDLNGQLTMNTSNSWREIDGNVHVQKIIADPFGNSSKRNRFLLLRQEVKQRITEWKKNEKTLANNK